MGASDGTVEFQSTGRPYLFDAWSGQQTPILNYTQTDTSTTIYFNLAANQAVIVAFMNNEKADYHAVSASRNVLAVTPAGSDDKGSLVAHIAHSADSSSATVTGSDGKVHTLSSSAPPPFELLNWTLVAEHWDPPTQLTDIDTVAVKATLRTRFQRSHRGRISMG